MNRRTFLAALLPSTALAHTKEPRKPPQAEDLIWSVEDPKMDINELNTVVKVHNQVLIQVLQRLETLEQQGIK